LGSGSWNTAPEDLTNRHLHRADGEAPIITAAGLIVSAAREQHQPGEFLVAQDLKPVQDCTRDLGKAWDVVSRNTGGNLRPYGDG
jgi:hypothetical protein